MRERTIPILIAGLILLALPAEALPAGDASQDIPITDPALLESLGFEPDATNVYATEQALRRMAMSPAERAAADEELLAATEAAPSGGPYASFEVAPATGPYGVATLGYSPVMYFNFLPIDGETDDEYASNADDRFCVNGSPTYVAQIEGLPHGAKLKDVQLWVRDSSGDRDVTASLVRYNNGGGSNVLDVASTSGAPGTTTLAIGTQANPIDADIDLRNHAYYLRVNLGNTSPCPDGIFLHIKHALVTWQRQVSPPPAIATFDDVPTGHPFFQHIEALAASEITSGCGGGDFCPNAPLTRGQMAVFLAKALGLHWGIAP